ncbi:M23 family metallopeptidase [Paenibacillus sp. J5C2022]|uniref:M23 family metallopeptidase n=1 Tax=Paenibacillus sp. J5C2022 TaxID=2977129 RepID=UPI0021CF8786|nr:M23 family metallopeptidase [Paenibacillus sp. J5C2022]
MNDQNQNNSQQNQEESPKTVVGEVSAAKSSNGARKLFAKRWVSPAIFMAAAAIIVTLMWLYQGSDPAEPTTGPENGTEVAQGDEGTGVNTGGEKGPDAVAVGTMSWPVVNKDAMNVETHYYDAEASETEKEAALIQVGTTFSPHTGVDFVDPEGESFDVLAALSGEVTYAGKHPLNGNMVEISHGEGLVTVYQSLNSIGVAQGDEVEQGEVIAQAGRNELEKDLGVHLHFETRLNGETVNPSDFISE